MTPGQAAHILTPLWLGVEAALERLATHRAEAIANAQESTTKELVKFNQAEDFILALGRRVDAATVDAVALDGMNGKVAIWPVSVAQRDQADAINRWLDANPEIKAARAERRRAWDERLDRAAAELRKVAPLRAAGPLEPLPAAGGSR